MKIKKWEKKKIERLMNVRVLFSEWVKDNKNNELNLNVSDILNFVKESVCVAQKS